MEKKIPSVYTLAVCSWFQFYTHHTGQEYVFSGIDGRHLKQLLKKIEIKIKQKGLESSEENISNSFKGFLASINDKWIIEHLEIKNVNSNFNTLYAKACNNNPFTNRIDDIINRKFGPQSATG